MRLPDFLGIGTQKGGTTYLHGLLKQHPQVYLAYLKKCTFSLHYDKGLNWYSHQFDIATADQRCGNYSLLPLSSVGCRAYRNSTP